MVVTTSHSSVPGREAIEELRDGALAEGTPFVRSHPPLMFVVTTFRFPAAGGRPGPRAPDTRRPPPGRHAAAGRSHSATEKPCSDADGRRRGRRRSTAASAAGVGVDLERAVVLPGDVQPRRHPHQTGTP